MKQKLRDNNMREVWEGVRTITGHNTKTRAVEWTMERANLSFFPPHTSPLTHIHTHRDTPVWNRAIYVSTYFREKCTRADSPSVFWVTAALCWGSVSLPKMPSTQKQSYVTDIKEGPLKAHTHSWHSNKPKETFSYQLFSCVCCY